MIRVSGRCAPRRCGRRGRPPPASRRTGPWGTPQAADGWHGLGLIAGARGQYAQAADDFARAASWRRPRAFWATWATRACGRAIPPAPGAAGPAAELAPDNPQVLANLALLLLVEGDAVKAQRVMDQARLGEEARAQVLRLASEVRSQNAPPRWRRHALRTPAAGAAPVSPVVGPMMDRLGNGPSCVERD